MSNPDLLFHQLGEVIAEAMNRLHVPGVAVGIFFDDKEYMAGLGVTNVEHPLPVGPDTLFQIGSITKTVTATAIMRLVEMGKLDLGMPLRTYLPELHLADEDVAEKVTLLHLLTHTGGWVGDYFEDQGPGDDALTKVVSKMIMLPQLTPLGEIWSYNNAGFYLAGRVIEVITGKTYEAAIKELVLDPLEMKHSFFFATDIMTYRFAVGHQSRSEGAVVLRPWGLPRAIYPAGGIISNVVDQLRYARFHMGNGTVEDGEAILAAESLRQMQSPMVLIGGAADACGISWLLRDIKDVRLVEHRGATNGQLSALTIVPTKRFVIAVMTNADRGSELNREICDWALAHYLGIIEPERIPLKLSEEQLSAYVGKYNAPLEDVLLSVDNGCLVMQYYPKVFLDSMEPQDPLPPVRLAFIGEDRVIALDPPLKNTRSEFLRDADGNIVWLRTDGRVHAREAIERL